MSGGRPHGRCAMRQEIGREGTSPVGGRRTGKKTKAWERCRHDAGGGVGVDRASLEAASREGEAGGVGWDAGAPCLPGCSTQARFGQGASITWPLLHLGSPLERCRNQGANVNQSALVGSHAECAGHLPPESPQSGDRRSCRAGHYFPWVAGDLQLLRCPTMHSAGFKKLTCRLTA